MSDLFSQFQSYDKDVVKEGQIYSGLLGLTIGGNRKVNISTRAGFVYVRLRDNLSEVLQAYNDKVSPVYDFPVLIQRKGNRWHVVGKDDQRYDLWGTSAPFLPAHGSQHSFNRSVGNGGDTVFVFDDQFMPLLVYPSGTYGASMLMVAPYLLQRSSDFIVAGGTGTRNLLTYKPTNNQAIMGLVVLNKTTGNPEVLIASGTPLSGTITGTYQVAPYFPFPASHQEPLYGFRLVSGTTALTWSNLYNARQFIGGNTSTGTSSSVPSFITGSIPFSASNGQLTEDNARLFWNDTNDQLFIGKHGAEQFDQDDVYPLVISSKTANNAVGYSVFTYGTGTLGGPSPTFVAWRSRGTYTTPDTVKKDDSLITISTLAYDGSGWNNNARIRFYADQNWITGTYRPTRMDFEVTPSGSATRSTKFQIYGDSVNIPTGSTYNIGGIPHELPAFEVHQTSAATGTSVAPSTNTVIVCNTKTFDSHGCYNTSNGRFTPTVAGTYLLYGYGFLANVADGKQVWVAIAKNGTIFRWLSLTNTSATNAEGGGGGSQMVFLDGVSDYAQLYIWHDDSTNRNLYNAGSNLIHFGGHRISIHNICGI